MPRHQRRRSLLPILLYCAVAVRAGEHCGLRVFADALLYLTRVVIPQHRVFVVAAATVNFGEWAARHNVPVEWPDIANRPDSAHGYGDVRGALRQAQDALLQLSQPRHQSGVGNADISPPAVALDGIQADGSDYFIANSDVAVGAGAVGFPDGDLDDARRFLRFQFRSRHCLEADKVGFRARMRPSREAAGDDHTVGKVGVGRECGVFLAGLRDGHYDDLVVVVAEQIPQTLPAVGLPPPLPFVGVIAAAGHCGGGQYQGDAPARFHHIVGNGGESRAQPGIAVADRIRPQFALQGFHRFLLCVGSAECRESRVSGIHMVGAGERGVLGWRGERGIHRHQILAGRRHGHINVSAAAARPQGGLLVRRQHGLETGSIEVQQTYGTQMDDRIALAIRFLDRVPVLVPNQLAAVDFTLPPKWKLDAAGAGISHGGRHR